MPEVELDIFDVDSIEEENLLEEDSQESQVPPYGTKRICYGTFS